MKSGTPTEVDVQVYQAVRAHEVELNRATAAFEHAVLAPLYLLNGGAAIAFLTLLGAASAEDSNLNVSTQLAVTAVGLWSLGLTMSALATWLGLQAQRGYSVDERCRRMRVERLLASDDIAEAVRSPVSDAAKALAGRARDNQRRFALVIGLSILLFLIGASVGAVAVTGY